MEFKVSLLGTKAIDDVQGDTQLQILQECMVRNVGKAIQTIAFSRSNKKRPTYWYSRGSGGFKDTSLSNKQITGPSPGKSRHVRVKYKDSSYARFSVRSPESMLKYAIHKRPAPITSIAVEAQGILNEVFTEGGFLTQDLGAFFK